MLSAAKDLDAWRIQILRCAQHDSSPSFSVSELDGRNTMHVVVPCA
jgi:hypothetical protein